MKDFIRQTEKIRDLQIVHRVNSLGGYGPQGEVIYNAHPAPCPSVLVDSVRNATVTFMSNGSVGFMVKLENGMEVKVLESHFDIAEKRETNAPSSGLWVTLDGSGPRAASLMAPRNNLGMAPSAIRMVKLGDPRRAMWYQAEYANGLFSSVRLSFVYTPKGPALVREVCLKNSGKKALSGKLFTHFTLHGTQRFVYNKEIWYDAGMPLSGAETVVCARVPYSDIVQVKRVSSRLDGFRPAGATCDYTCFVGDTAGAVIMPDAVVKGEILEGGAGSRLNRFAVPTIAANAFSFHLKPGKAAVLSQSLLYVTDAGLMDKFRKAVSAEEPTYPCMEAAFKKAARIVTAGTPHAVAASKGAGGGRADAFPFFELQMPHERVVSNYANSVWTGVKELYENCRAHGAKLADGIEIGTRDRAQDMWPKIKEDPGRVRADLVHAMSFMVVTVAGDPDRIRGRLTLRQKLHGMFPRQYPSHWFDRTKSVMNDNRPYTDSPLWLINALCMYARETGDVSILFETVKTVRLLDPDHPEKSGIIGNEKSMTILEVIREVFACFERHAKDTPYGVCQILYGDWCDPVDMFGTTRIGDASTRGKGRGVQLRLSAHAFLTLVEFIDLLETQRAVEGAAKRGLKPNLPRLKGFADRLRRNIVKTAWEDGPKGFPAGFLYTIHELKRNGARPAYARGEKGYTIGSYKGTDYDGLKRRELTVQAYGLEMLNTKRPWLSEIPGSGAMARKLLATVDKVCFNPRLGLVMFSMPMGNNQETLDCVGRMGVLPSGTAENGEYHHGQAFMHNFRMNVEGEQDTAWSQFKPMMSAMRDESIGGPFETPCTSYVSDARDPHFGKAMYFGLSGSTDWIVEIFHKVAGVTFALHDPARPALSVAPRLPAVVGETLRFRRVIHLALPKGGYRAIPFTLNITRKGPGKIRTGVRVTLNNREVPVAEVRDLAPFRKIDMDITYLYAGK